jgi:uncharacterized repeat protein (TIGR01451 family)
MSLKVTARRWVRVGVVAVIGLAGITSSTVAEAAIVIDDDEELTRFEIDGDPIKDTHSAVTPKNDFVSGDWGTGGVSSAYGPMAGSGSIAPEEYATAGVQPLLWDSMVAPDHPTVPAPGCNAGQDDNWDGGVKVADITNIDDVSDLTGCGQVLNKGNLVRAYTAYEVIVVEGVEHTIIYGAWERAEDPGELYFYVPISDGVAGNTDGDRLIAFDYDSSSGMVSFRVLAWTGSWTTIAVDPANFQGAVGFADGDPFAAGNPSFGEFALDLTAAGVLAPPSEGACLDYTTAGYVFTETGNSAGSPEPGEEPGNAQLKDYISAEPLDLSNCAEVNVTKTVNGATDWSFDFTISPVPTDEDATKPATDEEPTVGWGNIVAGEEYTISETVPAGWQGGALTCTGVTDLDGDVTDGSVTFVAEAAQEIDCAVTNNKLGSITIVKQTDPDLAVESFGFTFDGEPEFFLSDGQSRLEGDLVADSYEIVENDTSGWALTDIDCGEADVTTDVAEGTASVNLAWGENVTCTYTNTQQAKVIVVKQTDPDGSAQSFGFTFGATPFALSDGQSFDSGFVTPNVPYTITEGATSGWVLTGVACDNGVTSATNSVAVTPAPGQTVTCTFTNAERGPVTVLKSATGPVTQNGTTYTVGYTLTVTSASEIPEDYTLSDVPEFAPGTTIQSLVVNGPGVSDLDLGADGGEIISGTIEPHGELVFNVVATFTVDASTTAYECAGADTGTFNTATVVAFGGNSSSDCEPIPVADLAIVKTAPVGPFAPGSTFAWTLTVTNNGPAVADDVLVTDEVPGVLIVTGVTSADFSCTFTGNSVTCTRPSLAVGASGTISIAVQVPTNNTATSITNIGVVSASTPDPVPENNTDDATVPLVAQQVTPPPPPPVELPATGAGGVAALSKAAALLVGLGAVTLLLAQQRRRDRSVDPAGPTS